MNNRSLGVTPQKLPLLCPPGPRPLRGRLPAVRPGSSLSLGLCWVTMALAGGWWWKYVISGAVVLERLSNCCIFLRSSISRIFSLSFSAYNLKTCSRSWKRYTCMSLRAFCSSAISSSRCRNSHCVLCLKFREGKYFKLNDLNKYSGDKIQSCKLSVNC